MLTLRARPEYFLLAALALNAALWLGSKDMYARWAGVPPVPSRAGAVMMTLGDPQLAYRSGAITLQNLGDGGGRTTSLKDYDYAMLGKWLWLLDSLDPASEHVPWIAAFYFGAVRDRPESTRIIVDYLATVGRNPSGEKWRWLAEAAFLARHRLNDLPRALDIAYSLSRMESDLPYWARELPAFILKEQGEKADARVLLLSYLASGKNLPPQEINFLKAYLSEQLGMTAAEIEEAVRLQNKKN